MPSGFSHQGAIEGPGSTGQVQEGRAKREGDAIETETVGKGRCPWPLFGKPVTGNGRKMKKEPIDSDENAKGNSAVPRGNRMSVSLLPNLRCYHVRLLNLNVFM